MFNSRFSFCCACFASLSLLIGLLFLSLSYGTIDIPLEQVASFFQLNEKSLPTMAHTILFDIRLPRFLLAVIVGAGLAMVGTLLQTVTKNDLADPFLFGLSAGASAGAVTVLSHFGNQLGQWALPIAAFIGGILSAISVLILFSLQRSRGIERLILCGLAISFLFGAITSYMIYTGDQRSASTLLFWSLGGLGLARWDNLIFALIGVLCLIVLTVFRWRSLDAMLVDEQTSLSIGVSVKQLRLLVFITTALATASFVSITGVIGFIGLIVPHLARPICGVSHRFLMPLSAILGAILMVFSDLISRTLIQSQELPIGLVTSALGGFFILAFVLKKD